MTRNSPNLSQSLWENFQPDQLFPENTDIDMGQNFGINQQNLDPALQMAGMGTSSMAGQMRMPPQSHPQQAIPQQRMGSQSSMSSGLQQDSGWTNQMSPDDTWSNSSFTGQSVPTTLNVEDW